MSWHKKTRRGFFLRTEDYFGYLKKLSQLRDGLESDLKVVKKTFENSSYSAQLLAQQPLQRELRDLRERYDGDLDQRSHGESFLDFYHERIIPDGLYLLDEPEIAFSPSRQLALISFITQMVEKKAQLIIATHSPLLLALPGASILSFDVAPIQPMEYKHLESVNLTRTFLNNPEQFLRHL